MNLVEYLAVAMTVSLVLKAEAMSLTNHHRQHITGTIVDYHDELFPVIQQPTITITFDSNQPICHAIKVLPFIFYIPVYKSCN